MKGAAPFEPDRGQPDRSMARLTVSHWIEKMPLDTERKKDIQEQYRTHANDTGSTEVQVALLTERITTLTDHLRANNHDESTRRGLLKLVGQRRRLLRYLNREDVDRYRTLIGRLGLRK